MSTSGGVTFRCDEKTYIRIQKLIPQLDEITNDSGLGVACTPIMYKREDGLSRIFAQTHWSYDGTNGKVFVEEFKKILKRKRIKVEIVKEDYA